jgi:hypothetical protein
MLGAMFYVRSRTANARGAIAGGRGVGVAGVG